MKKILLASAIVCLAIAACKREPIRCWRCDYTYSGIKPDTTGDTVLCNYTQTDIELRQDVKIDAATAGYDWWMITNCKKQ